MQPCLPQHVLVGELDRLWRPGRARGVDQRRDVLARHRAARLARSQSPPVHQPPAPPTAESRAEPHQRRTRARSAGSRSAIASTAIRELPLGDHHPALGMSEQVLDLLRRGGVVDRERDRTQVHRGAVHDQRLGAVAEHHPDRVPTTDARRPPAHRPACARAGHTHAQVISNAAAGGSQSDLCRRSVRRSVETPRTTSKRPAPTPREPPTP